MTGRAFPDDEAIARALQEQYSREFRQSSSYNNRGAASTSSNNGPAPFVVRGRPVSSPSPPPAPPPSSRLSRGDLIAGRSTATITTETTTIRLSSNVSGPTAATTRESRTVTRNIPASAAQAAAASRPRDSRSRSRGPSPREPSFQNEYRSRSNSDRNLQNSNNNNIPMQQQERGRPSAQQAAARPQMRSTSRGRHQQPPYQQPPQRPTMPSHGSNSNLHSNSSSNNNNSRHLDREERDNSYPAVADSQKYYSSRGNSRCNNDQEFARRLQEQLSRTHPAAPPSPDGRHRKSTNSNNMRDSREGFIPSQRSPGPGTPTAPHHVEDSDAEYARRLQSELLQEESVIRDSANRRNPRSSPDFTAPPKGNPTPLTSRTSSEVSSLSYADEEIAMRAQQEMYDEELARRLALKEQERLNAARARRLAASNTAAAAPKGCTTSKVISYMVPLVFIIAAIAGIVYYFMRPDDFPNIFPTPEDFRNEDPFTAIDPSQADRWKSTGNGLNLEVVNALDSSWNSFFLTAVAAWDNGDPDSLTLTTSSQQPDYACDAINGKLKVCNGDYGNTRWRGINKILLTGGYIFASAARMNEYYLQGASDDQKQYTMCHEIGHGFGLPHSDESFTNKDLGNCMDYTNNPTANMQPDVANFNYLADLYGTVPGYVRPANTTTTDDVIPLGDDDLVDNGATDAQKILGPDNSAVTNNYSNGGNGRRYLRDQQAAVVASTSIPEWVMEKARLLDEELNNYQQHQQALNAKNRWRLLHRSDGLEAHELDLGEGFTIQIRKLLASCEE